MDRTPGEYRNDLNANKQIFDNNKSEYLNTYHDYMIGEEVECHKQENINNSKCKNIEYKENMKNATNDIINDIGLIKSKLKDLGENVSIIQNNWDEKEQNYAMELSSLKNIKEKNAESIMMKKITEDNQAINIVESIYLVSGISFMIFFIIKQLNK